MADLSPCKGPCRRVTRPSNTTITEFPDTVRRHGAGMCSACYRVSHPHEEQDLTPEQARRLEAAFKAKERVEADRAARAGARSIRAVRLGQDMVRI